MLYHIIDMIDIICIFLAGCLAGWLAGCLGSAGGDQVFDEVSS